MSRNASATAQVSAAEEDSPAGRNVTAHENGDAAGGRHVLEQGVHDPGG